MTQCLCGNAGLIDSNSSSNVLVAVGLRFHVQSAIDRHIAALSVSEVIHLGFFPNVVFLSFFFFLA